MSAGFASGARLPDWSGESFAGAFGAVFGSFVIFGFSGKRQSLSDRSQVALRACDYNGGCDGLLVERAMSQQRVIIITANPS